MNLRISFVLLVLLLSCSGGKSSDTPAGLTVAKSGSTSAFSVVGNYLYALDGQGLQVWRITEPSQPTLVTTFQAASSTPETVFGADSLLLVGTRNGVLFYSIADPERPVLLSTYAHIVSCDPVVAQGHYAYVTLRTGNPCQRGVNLFEIINFSDLFFPTTAGTLMMNNPKGLAVSGNYAYVCENQGIQVIDISKPDSIIRKLHLFGTFSANDLILDNNRLIITANDGIYQYDISNIYSPVMLSRLLFSL